MDRKLFYAICVVFGIHTFVAQGRAIALTPVSDNQNLRIRRCGVENSSRKRRGINSSRQKRYILQGTTWNKTVLTWRVDEYTTDLPKFMTRHIIQKAFQKWSAWIPLTFAEKPLGKVDISIKFLRKMHKPCKVPFDGKDGSIAHAYYPYQGQELAGDIHFDDDEKFTHNSTLGTNLDWTALHEIGHSLGLEHSLSYGAVMSPYYNSFYHPDLDHLALSTDDIRGIQALYGRLRGLVTNRVDLFPAKKTRFLS